MWTTSDNAVTCKLQKSVDGVDWHDVSGSQLTIDAGKGRYQRTLGVGSTLSTSSHGRAGRGYRYYRLIATGRRPAALKIDHVRFWLTGLGTTATPTASCTSTTTCSPGRCKAPSQADELATRRHPGHRRIRTRRTVPSANPVDAQRQPMATRSSTPTASPFDGVVEPGTDFYLRPAPGTSATTLTATTPHHLTGRVLTGVALEGRRTGSHRLP